MVGNEGETEEDLKSTIDLVISEKINTDFSLVRTYPGTLIYRHALNKGMIKNEWEYLYTPLDFPSFTATRTISYLNISSIPDSSFWRIISEQCRRFYTNYQRLFRLKNPRIWMRWFGLEIQGNCTHCENMVTLRKYGNTAANIFNIIGNCHNCRSPVTLDLYGHEPYRSHKEKLKMIIQKSDTIILCGNNLNISEFLTNNSLDLDYSFVIGICNLNEEDIGAWISDKQIYSFYEMQKIKPDVILIIDDPRELSHELHIRMRYVGQDCVIPQILHALPKTGSLLQRNTYILISLSENINNIHVKKELLGFGILIA